MMSSLKKMFIACLALVASSTVLSATPVEQLLQEYQTQGASQPSVESGKVFWNQKFYSSKTRELRSCTSCHTANLRQYGKHVTTGKEIKPLAPSVMSKRLTNPKKISRWFSRNCNWTLGRECSAQEKADVLMYLKDL